MNDVLKVISGVITAAMFSGCASMEGANGPRGPRLTGGGYSNEYGSYAEVGVEFSSVGDFVAIVSPKRWKNPVATGGTLSWVNPVAWSEDAGRTGRILLGEAVVVGGAVAAASLGGSSGGDSGSGSADSGGSAPASPGGSAPVLPGGGAPPGGI